MLFRSALLIAKSFHILMWLLLIALSVITDLGAIYLVGVVISGFLLLIEHGIIDPKHQLKMNFAAYHINQIISMLLLVSVTLDVFL